MSWPWFRLLIPSPGPRRAGPTLSILILLVLTCLARGLRASPDLATVCDAAAVTAAQQTGVPLSVMRAITRVETGRPGLHGLSPWPWTVNMEGDGQWFPTEAEARRFAQAHLDAGVRSFDIGCFQLNYRWHGQAFASIDAMFEPEANALYAAQFLSSLHDEYGDWDQAAGAYHSRNPDLAGAYRARFTRLRMALLSGDPPIAIPSHRDVLSAPATRIAAAYPLLQSGAVGGLGSLVPLADEGRPLFGPEPQG